MSEIQNQARSRSGGTPLTSIQKALMALLAIQVVAVVIAWWPRTGAGPDARPLIDVAREEIQAVEIRGPADAEEPPEPVRLERSDGQWRVASAHGYPADPAEVDQLLDHLLGIEVRTPIATRAVSHGELDVGEDSCDRRVRLETADEHYEILVGASARSAVHVRLASSDEVYRSRGFSAWSIGTSDRRYYDAVLVDVPLDSVRVLRIANDHDSFQLDQRDGEWTLLDLEEGATLDTEAVEDLARDALDLRSSGIAAAEPGPEHGLQGESAVRVSWTAVEGEDTLEGSYLVGAKQDDEHYLQLEGTPHVVKVRESTVKPVLEATVEGLLEQEEDPT